MINLLLETLGIPDSPKWQTPSNRGTQSQWVLMQDSQAAEESSKNSNPKVLPLGFFVGERKNKMREPRVYKEGSIYHITVDAGIREPLFSDEADHAYFVELLNSRKEKYNFKLHAYRLLHHRFHLLIEPSPDANISKIMQAINTSYSLYFNNKYKRSGHLFSSRYKYELVEKEENSIAAKMQELQDVKDDDQNGVRFIFSSGPILKAVPVLTTVILIAGLLISWKVLPYIKHHRVASFMKNQVQAGFPQGLPIYSAVGKTQERQVWELWKLGPQE